MSRIRYLLFAIVLSVPSAGSAQYFNGGVIGGVVASQVAGDTYSGFNKAGAYGGGFVNVEIRRTSVLQVELAYYMKGSRHNPDKNDPSTYIFRANYAEMPFLYQYKFSKKFRGEVGPSVGILINYVEERDGYTVVTNRPAQLSLQLNLGLYYKLSRRLRVNIRTNNSILNIRSQSAPGDVRRIFDYGQYHDSLVLSLFYQFKDDRR